MTSPISIYLKAIESELIRGDATEHTHRPALKTFIESLTPGITATNEPTHVECGAPDFVISSKASVIGYTETMDVGINLTLQYHKVIYQIRVDRPTYAMRKAVVTISENAKGDVSG